MELDVNFTRAQEAISTAESNLEIAKESYAMVCNSKKKKAKGNKGEATPSDSKFLALVKAGYKKGTQAVASAKLTITTEGAKAFELYGNLLSDKAPPAWEKII
jgi:hypothetical protein